MGTTTESKQRHRARVERRRDRALVRVAVAQRLGIGVATLADAMRQAGFTAALTEAQAQQWVVDPATAPEWLVQMRAERRADALIDSVAKETALRDLALTPEVVEVDGPLFEATYSLKSGQWRSGWFDLAALQTCEMGSL